MDDRTITTANGQPVKITYGPATSFGLTYGPHKRRLPRLTLTRKHDYWAARLIAQNDSYLEAEATSRRAAIIAVLRIWRQQRWPLLLHLRTIR